MPLHKFTTFLSEISTFFKNNDAHNAMNSITILLKGVKMSEKTLLGVASKNNTKYKLLHVFQILLLYPCFMIGNPYKYDSSPLFNLISCKKDVFYRFMASADINWRKLLYHINLQLWSKIRVRSDHKDGTTCLIIDDTDYPKTGRQMENIGRIHSHLAHKSILGFKALFMCITDGTSQMLLDFSLLGEKGKKGNYSMSNKELSRRFSKKRNEDAVLNERLNEYSMSKIELMISMIKRAIGKGVRFRYVLADSWFACGEIIKFIHSRHINCDYLGAIKVGEKGNTKYHFKGLNMTAPALIKYLTKRGEKRYSRKLKCYYITADVRFVGVNVRLFFIRRSKNGAWSGLITTDIELDFFEAYKIYSQRWAIEVLFKETKGLLGLGKCQARNFASQIAATSIVALQYNLLSVVKRFNEYETMGQLFHQATKDSLELSITQRIWGAIQEVICAIADIFNLTDDQIYEVIINRSDELENICNIYKEKIA